MKIAQPQSLAEIQSLARRRFAKQLMALDPAQSAFQRSASLAIVSACLLTATLAVSANAGPVMLAQTVAPPAPVEAAPLPPPPGRAPIAPANPAPPGSPPSAVAPPAGSVPPASAAPQQALPQSPLPPAPPNAALESPQNPNLQNSGAQNSGPQNAAPGAVPPAAVPPQPGGQITTSAPPRDLSNEPDLIELVIEPRPVLILQAEASNDDAFPALLAALNRLGEEARRAGVLVTGRPFAVIDLTDDKKFKFQAMLPVENTATTPPIPGLRFGQSPSGQAIRFKYAGAYEDNTYVYESIEAYIEERDIKARPYAIEEFLTDPKDSGDASLQMFIYYLRE